MARRLKFQALAPELIPVAEQVASFLMAHGFGIRADEFKVGFPHVPTIHCTRKPVVLLIEILDHVILGRVEEWVAYCGAVPTDMRLGLGMPEEAVPGHEEMTRLQDLGVGLYLVGRGRVRELLAPTDQGMHGAAAKLPILADLSRPVRELIGPVYEKIGRGDWREAFQEACQVFEDEARKYFKHWSKTTRIKVHRKVGPHTLSANKINHLTMGQLAQVFREIISPNQLVLIIGQTLDDVLGDRNLVMHKKRRARTEARLRRNWRAHFWKIVGALTAIHG